MSASLVGSEMCIRDSRWTAQSSLLGPTAALAVFRAVGQRSMDYTIPVSYTHLTLPTICSV
eukprot:6768681-Alexandrium_andersonii.AAC.1